MTETTGRHGVIFRLARPDDFGQIAELRWCLQTQDDADFDPRDRDRFATVFTAWLSRPENRLNLFHWVVEQDNRLIAVMSVRKIDMLPSPKKLDRSWGYLANAYTRPDFRALGIGADLLDKVKRWASEEKLAELVVWPRENRTRFYERAGFAGQGSPLVLRFSDRP